MCNDYGPDSTTNTIPMLTRTRAHSATPPLQPFPSYDYCVIAVFATLFGIVMTRLLIVIIMLGRAPITDSKVPATLKAINGQVFPHPRKRLLPGDGAYVMSNFPRQSSSSGSS